MQQNSKNNQIKFGAGHFFYFSNPNRFAGQKVLDRHPRCTIAHAYHKI